MCTEEYLRNSLPPPQDLSPQDVAENQIILNACMLLGAKINNVAETKICTKILPYVKSSLSRCRRDELLRLVTKSVPPLNGISDRQSKQRHDCAKTRLMLVYITGTVRVYCGRLREMRLCLETGRFDTNSSCEIAQKFRSLKREKEEHFW